MSYSQLHLLTRYDKSFDLGLGIDVLLVGDMLHCRSNSTSGTSPCRKVQPGNSEGIMQNSPIDDASQNNGIGIQNLWNTRWPADFWPYPSMNSIGRIFHVSRTSPYPLLQKWLPPQDTHFTPITCIFGQQAVVRRIQGPGCRVSDNTAYFSSIALVA